jgi:hypothetical protein
LRENVVGTGGAGMLYLREDILGKFLPGIAVPVGEKTTSRRMIRTRGRRGLFKVRADGGLQVVSPASTATGGPRKKSAARMSSARKRVRERSIRLIVQVL